MVKLKCNREMEWCNDMNKLTQDFINPPNDYRPLPFWSWNNRLESDLLKKQLEEMSKGGLGGYFMHSRGGIVTDYLGDGWMQCVKDCIEKGNETGMQSWLYDESGWPSGFADGKVTALGDAYYARGLAFEQLDGAVKIKGDDSILGVYEYDPAKNTVMRLKNTETEFADDDLETIIIRHTAGPYYIDVLNEKVVAEFIRFTHEKYYNLFGAHFGKGMQGFFTDEPRLSQGEIPWSYILPDKFSEKYHADILDILPCLFIGCAGYEKARYQFWQLVSELFVTAFMKQIHDWCESHNCKLTGHVMMEESIYSQMTGTSGSMPFYEYMSMPGMDWLRRMIYNPIIPKQVSSAAAQTGKKFVLTESYALCGWNISFEELKWIAEWQFVNGVNRMCQHLFAYSLEGFRKRDYPPSHFYQQSWWKEYNLFTDYLSRLCVLLTTGTQIADVLLLHPMRSGWVAYDGQNNDVLKKLDADFASAAQTLSSLHYDYHLGDETYISKYGSVCGDTIKVGQCSYMLVVLPSMLTCDKNTARLLSAFISNGGTVVSLGDFPSTCGGESCAELETLKTGVVCINGDTSKLVGLLSQSGADGVRITENQNEIDDICCQQRLIGASRLVYMVNLSKEKRYNATVMINGSGKAARVSIENGILSELKSIKTDKGVQFALEFLPMQSHMILLGDTSLLELPVRLPVACAKPQIIRSGKTFNVAKQDMNAITLDFCDCEIDGAEPINNIPVIKLFDQLLALKRSCDLKLHFRFDAQLDLAANKALYLILESPEKFKISVNGTNLSSDDIGWWKDTAFRKLDIKSLVKNGQNEIILECGFFQSQKVYDVLFGDDVYETEMNKLTYDTEIESIYLAGDFSVFSKSTFTPGDRGALFTDGPFVLRDSLKTVETGDLTAQGYAFFAGSLLLEQQVTVTSPQGGAVLLDIGVPDAAVTKIFVNGDEVETVAWRPYLIDITQAVRQGENTIGIELFSGNRNLLGPHHHTGGEIYNVGPDSFKGKWSWCDRPTEAVESNSADMTKNYWQNSYCMVRFGLSDQFN
jgi:hypothetical protein